MTPHPRHQSVTEAQADIAVRLYALQRDHGLTDTEMLQAVATWQAAVLKHMLRAERHPDDPDKAGDEE